MPAWCILFDDVKTLNTGIRLRGRHKTFTFPNNVDSFQDIRTDDGSSNCNDIFSGAMWFFPEGVTLTLYQNGNQRGNTFRLEGTGKLEFINLAERGFNDRVSSIEWSS
ncbi:MAG: hypothetical protein AAGF95_34640 [Chloroflexota bacterium]